MKEILLKLQALQLVAFEKGIPFDIEGCFNATDLDDNPCPRIEVWSRDEDGEVLNVSFAMWRQNEWEKNLKIAETWTM